MVTQSLTALHLRAGDLTLLDVVQVWHIVVIAFCAGAVESLDQPARQSLYPHLIDRKVMGSAVAFNSCLWQGHGSSCRRWPVASLPGPALP